jgi:deoxyribodipyrimidine photo-lyase
MRISSIIMNLNIPTTASLSSGLVWFKGTDLRLRDNIALSTAHRTCDQVVHTFVIDPTNFRISPTSSAKYSYKRLRFLGESLFDLHTSLKLAGSKLNVIVGPTDVALLNIASGLGNCNLYFHDEYIYEERQLLTKTLSALTPICAELHPFWGGATLYEQKDLTESVSQLGQFTVFRKAMEGVPIKAPISQPEVFRASPCIASFDSSECILLRDEQMTISGIIDALRSVAESESCNSNTDDMYLSGAQSAPLVSGGESFGWSRIEYYILSGTGRLSCYKDTRNGMIGMDFSSKLSYWLSTGSITARQVALAVQQYESDSGVSNESTRFLLFELLWRDYMKFYGIRWKEKMFYLGGPQGEVGRKKQPWKTDAHLISAWKNGVYINSYILCLMVIYF